MRPGGGKQKGASKEREVCRALSLWMSDGQRDDLYWRSAMSGGRATVAHRKGVSLAAQAGDISCVHPMGHPLTERFTIEVKHYKCLDYPSLLTGKGNLANFWKIAKAEAAKYNKLPCLIGQQNRHPAVVCLTHEGLIVLNVRLKCSLTAPKLDLYMVLLDDFVQYARRPNGTVEI